MIEYSPALWAAEEVCSRCSRPLRTDASSVMVCTPPTQYRFSHVDLCQLCTAKLWRFLDELKSDRLAPDFVVEAVGDESVDLVFHPRSDASRKWVADLFPPRHRMHLYGGIVVSAGAYRDAGRRVIGRAIARDGLRIAEAE